MTSSVKQIEKRKADHGTNSDAWKRQKVSERLARESARLPVAQCRAALVAAVRAHQVVVVVGETGSGKTTQLPQYLRAAFSKEKGAVACTQPRRVAAVTVATRVALEQAAVLGSKVGYSVRFDDCSSTETEIKYLTDGMLLREALADKSGLLPQYSVIIIDEAHERTVHTDVLCGLLKGILKKRPELRVVIMSATLNADQFSVFFNNCPVLYVRGRQFPVKIMYPNEPVVDYLDAALVTTMQIHEHEPPGDILVFLSGQEEIESLERLILDCGVKELQVCPIYAAMAYEKQLEVFQPAVEGKRKVIIATNIAETSVTISGVKYVVDTGVVKVRSYQARTGVDLLRVQEISKAQASQRCGRAGRESAGICYRLYTENAYQTLPDTPIPEIKRTSLSAVILMLIALGMKDVISFDFMEPPPRAAIEAGLTELFDLNALDEGQNLTPMGRDMSRLPVDPRLARALLAGAKEHCLQEVLIIAAMLSSEGVWAVPHHQKEEAGEMHKRLASPFGDHLTLLNVWTSFHSASDRKHWCKEYFISSRAMKHADQVRKQLHQLCEKMKLAIESCGSDTTAPRRALVAGFFLNVARIEPDQKSYKTLHGSTIVHIHPASTLFGRQPAPRYVLFHEQVQTRRLYMRDCVAIEVDWLCDMAPHKFARAKQ